MTAVWVSARCEACGLATVVAAGGRPGAELVCDDCGGPVYVVEDDAPVVDDVALPMVVDLGRLVGCVETNEADGPDDCDLCAAAGELCLFHVGWAAGWTAHAVAALGGGS